MLKCMGLGISRVNEVLRPVISQGLMAHQSDVTGVVEELMDIIQLGALSHAWFDATIIWSAGCDVNR